MATEIEKTIQAFRDGQYDPSTYLEVLEGPDGMYHINVESTWDFSEAGELRTCAESFRKILQGYAFKCLGHNGSRFSLQPSGDFIFAEYERNTTSGISKIRATFLRSDIERLLANLRY